ncbi:hypothetical protein JW721_03805 [Candidatus Micrarchaeota archaeon]|nr:hypothetical protein [Candidatus Micrarchaeota archaeon]
MINVGEDDFLIATDIDRLIDILSTRKDVEVGNLSRELKMNRKEVEKWLHVLEEEGLVDLVNRVGSLHVVWIMGSPHPQEHSRRKKAPQARPREPAPARRETPVREETPAAIELATEIGAMRSVAPPLPSGGSGKSLFSGIFRGRRLRKKSSAKAPPRISIEDEESGAEPEAEEPAPIAREYVPTHRIAKVEIQRTEPAGLEDDILEDELLQDEEEKLLPLRKSHAPSRAEPIPTIMAHEIAPEPEARMKKKLEKSEFLKLPRSQTGKLRARLEDYLQLIREGKRELNSLETEKEKIHREGFLSLEKDFEASLDNIEYALLEKEKRILEAKERFSSIPEKIGTLNEIQESLSGFDSDARELLSKTREDLDSRWSRLQEVGEELSEELAKGEDEAMHERSRMMQLRDMLQSIDHAESQLRETLVSSRSVIEEMEEKVRDVEDSLETLSDSRALLEERIEGIRSALERKMRGLDELRTQMEQIEEVESWFREYSEDYESKMDELQQYVQESEEELSHIKKAAELEYVKRYLGELEGTEQKYRDNLGALEMEEASIDEKISEVRSRIKQLMRESSELMSKYRQMTEGGAGFEEMVATAKSKSRVQLRTIEEKARQRGKLPSSIAPSLKKAAPKTAKSAPRPKARTKKRASAKKPSGRSGRKSRK